MEPLSCFDSENSYPSPHLPSNYSSYSLTAAETVQGSSIFSHQNTDLSYKSVRQRGAGSSSIMTSLKIWSQPFLGLAMDSSSFPLFFFSLSTFSLFYPPPPPPPPPLPPLFPHPPLLHHLFFSSDLIRTLSPSAKQYTHHDHIHIYCLPLLYCSSLHYT